ncbi:MAG: efflux RND transporter permease subunit, partial [Burkholderiales bacterium]|nr:efflux RND transporter permease subunit [Burkholderiales bacterium]
PDRDAAADVKVDTRQIAVALQAMMGGVDISKFKIDGQRYDIRVKADDSFRRDAEAIRRIVLRTPGGSRVEMGSVVDVVEGLGPNSIKRYNRMRSVTIMANVAPGIAVGDAAEKFGVLAKDVMKAYPGYQIAASGMTKIMNESFQYLMFALASSIVIIYLILAAQFESFIHPFTIMMTLPLAIVGVFLGLLLTGKTFSIFAIIGLIMLVGIVTRNGILLVDFANQQRAKGVPAHQAMLMAGPVRLRPILMTALAAMVGILPVALGLSEGGESRSGMGVAVIGGLLTSTLLTLFVIPTAYLTFEGIVRNLGLVRDRVYGLFQSDEREHS